MHRDKETPPLLAFPWFGAQFLSHSFLALERDPRFTIVTKFLNNAEIAPFVPGANFTFFVPMDSAFQKHRLNLLTEDEMATEKAIKFLLNHFVKGRLYDKHLNHDEVFESIGGSGLKIQRPPTGNSTTQNFFNPNVKFSREKKTYFSNFFFYRKCDSESCKHC